MLGHDDHNIAGRLVCAVVKGRWRVEVHGQAVIFGEVIAYATEYQLDTARLHPNLLLNCHIIIEKMSISTMACV